MRNFLRLDFVYQQAVHHHTRPDPWSTRAAVPALLEILAITQRGDIRSEVLKELERQTTALATFAAGRASTPTACACCSPSSTACATS